jgi:hypothetical protein
MVVRKHGADSGENEALMEPLALSADSHHRGVLTDLASRQVAELSMREMPAGVDTQAPPERDQSGSFLIRSLRRGLSRVSDAICLISAVQLHEITLQSPSKTWGAIGEKERMPKVTDPPEGSPPDDPR